MRTWSRDILAYRSDSPNSYDIFAINIASVMLGYVYGAGQLFISSVPPFRPLIVSSGGKLNANQDLGIKVATPVGTLVGQLFFGWLADVIGRKKMCKY